MRTFGINIFATPCCQCNSEIYMATNICISRTAILCTMEEPMHILKRQPFCDTTKYRFVDSYRRFARHCSLHRHSLGCSWTADRRKIRLKSNSENSANSCLNYKASHLRRHNTQAIVHVSCPAYTKFLTYAPVSTPSFAMPTVYILGDI
jgi:hypothetical protein